MHGPREDGSPVGRSGCLSSGASLVDGTGAMAAEQDPVPANKRTGVCRKAAAGHKRGKFRKRAVPGFILS